MEKEIIQPALAVTVAGLLVYLVIKKIKGNRKRNREKEKEFISMQRRKFSDAYGEYTL
ncbi:MAG: hypothetical protein ACXWWC_15950 [Chitinophagaceae bacterium]